MFAESLRREGGAALPAGLEELDVGIAGFANAAPGFEALFRERFSDFIVHEVPPPTWDQRRDPGLG